MSEEKGYTNQALELNESGKSPHDNSEVTAAYKNVVSIGMAISHSFHYSVFYMIIRLLST